jgi:methylmalonyl-CoA mutase cobalamin-binding domain/chain
VSAASLFDGHDAAINMIRRLLQSSGAEVVHLGHNRSVSDIVRAAIQEDADGIAVSSYQGGHNEYFKYMVDMLKEQGCEHIRVVVGGGGTISRTRSRCWKVRRREDLHARGRPAHGPAADDRGRDDARAAATQAALRIRPAARPRSPAHRDDDHRARRRGQRGRPARS